MCVCVCCGGGGGGGWGGNSGVIDTGLIIIRYMCTCQDGGLGHDLTLLHYYAVYNVEENKARLPF